MRPFTSHTGIGIPLRRSSVDTDQIIPAEYLKRITRTGFDDGLFAAWRKDPQFVLNQPGYAGASILVAGPDFGIGSSREHAVWALQDFGFRAVLSSRFGDIFRTNAGKAGLLTGVVAHDVVERLWALLEQRPGRTLTVDLHAREVRTDDGNLQAPFAIDDYTRYRLLAGLDDIDLTFRHVDDIAAYEANRPSFKPKTLAG